MISIREEIAIARCIDRDYGPRKLAYLENGPHRVFPNPVFGGRTRTRSGNHQYRSERRGHCHPRRCGKGVANSRGGRQGCNRNADAGHVSMACPQHDPNGVHSTLHIYKPGFGHDFVGTIDPGTSADQSRHPPAMAVTTRSLVGPVGAETPLKMGRKQVMS